MTTTTSYSKYGKFFGLYKSTFRRNIGYFALLSALLAVFYPLQYVLEITKSISPNRLEYFSEMQAKGIPLDPFYLYQFLGGGYNFTGVSAFFFTVIVILAPVVLALLLNNYMHHKNAVDVYHALPLRRGTLLSVNMAVAMSYIAIPVVVSSLLILVIQIAKFGFLPAVAGRLLADTFCWLVAAFCMYAVTAFVTVLAGTVFDTFVFTSALVLAPPAFYMLALLLAQMFLFGYSLDAYAIITASNLSPATAMIQRFAFMPTLTSPDSEMLSAITNNNIAVLIWLVLGVLLFCLSIRLYRTRRSERAETTSSRGILPTAVKLIGTVAVSVFAGMFFQSINSDGGKAVCLLWTAITGILTYAILEVLFNRGFKTLVRSLPLGAAMVAVTVGLSLIPMTGAFGYETRIPSAENIASVKINPTDRFSDGIRIVRVTVNSPYEGTPEYLPSDVVLTDPAAIATVLDFHQDVVSRRLFPQEGFTIEPDDGFASTAINISYTLKNGTVVQRFYPGASFKTMAKLAPLDTNPESLRQGHGAFFTVPKDISKWTVTDVHSSNSVSPNLSLEETTKLLQAMQNDLLALTLDELKHPTQSPAAILSYEAKVPAEERDRFITDQQFTVSAATKETYKFLEERGLLKAVAPNMSDCYAVTAVPMGDGSSTRSGDKPILELTSRYTGFTYSELDNVRKELENYQENPDDKETRQMYYKNSYQIGRYGYANSTSMSRQTIYENPEEIALLAEKIVGSYTIEEPLIYANFYFKNRASGSPVLIPLSSLPEEMQKPYREWFGLEYGLE